MDAGAPPPWDWGVADPRNTLLPPRVALSNLVAVGQTFWAQAGVPKILETLGTRSLGMGAW